MKKLFLIGLLSIFCLNLFGCGSKNSEDSVVLPPTNDELLDLVAQALPCDEGTGFANFALLGTGVSRQGELMYYGVAEIMGFVPNEELDGIRNTCYIISPIAMEIHQSDKGFSLVNVDVVDTYLNNFLLEDYNPEFDGGKLDEGVKAIFSSEAFAVRQQRNYWEYFLDYNDENRKSYDERAMEYFGIEANNEEGSDIEEQENHELESFGPSNYTILGLNDGFEEQMNAGMLVLRGSYEDHTDYIFLPAGTREDLLNPVNGGEEVTFQGKVVGIDGAAGSHYYNAEIIEQLELVN